MRELCLKRDEDADSISGKPIGTPDSSSFWRIIQVGLNQLQERVYAQEHRSW